MLISRTAGIIALSLAGWGLPMAAQASPFETQQLEGWTLNAWSADKTGSFTSCTMRMAGNDQVSLNIGEAARGRWFMTLFRSHWDLERNNRFIATLNFDQDRKKPIALDARVNNEHHLALIMPSDRHVLDMFSAATSVRISREKQAYTFTLAGYGKAMQWVKDCVARNVNTTQEASKPDSTIRGEDEDPVEQNSTEGGRDKPAEAPVVKPTLAPGVIETKADEPEESPEKSVASDTSPITPPVKIATLSTTSDSVTKPAVQPQVASIPTEMPPISDAAKASIPIVEPPASSAAQSLLPGLMAAANRSDFKLINAATVPAAQKRGDAFFQFADMTGAIMTVDLPTSAAAINEVLAYDRIACAGDYSANTSPTEDGHADIQRSTSQCKTGDKSVLSQYVTLSKKSGGFFVVALTSETTASAPVASDKLADTDRTLFDAAIKVSGKF